MKKTYIVPAIKAICVRTERIMAGSVDVTINDTEYNGGDDGIGAKDELDFGW